ncbi:MAG: hypothetical protein R3F37_22585 [Candidatus Competibacteraceae bacterium]
MAKAQQTVQDLLGSEVFDDLPELPSKVRKVGRLNGRVTVR